MIAIEDLSFAYKGRMPLFGKLDLFIAKGESWTVIGPSGCGKSTLLYLLAGLKKPSGGCIRIDGMPVSRPRPLTGLVLQDHGLLPWATVRENVRLGLTIREFYGPDGRHSPAGSMENVATADRRVDAWLDRLGIADLSQHYPGQLSRGQRQRTAIARTLVLGPDLLLMDEPFSALDAPIRIDLQQEMKKLHRESPLTSVVVTHDIEEAVFLGEKILVFDRKSTSDNVSVVKNSIRLQARHDVAFQRQCGVLRKKLGDSYGKTA